MSLKFHLLILSSNYLFLKVTIRIKLNMNINTFFTPIQTVLY